MIILGAFITSVSVAYLYSQRDYTKYDEYQKLMGKLRSVQQNVYAGLGNGQSIQLHSISFGSNPIIEDQIAHQSAAGTGDSTWFYALVADGHAGAATGLLLKERLIPQVSLGLSTLDNKASNVDIINAIKSTFRDLDDGISNTALLQLKSGADPDSDAVKKVLAPAYAGSCALMALYDPSTYQLRVACTGDSRAVLGKYKENATGSGYDAIPLSVDQTGYNPKEVERIRLEHPGEEDVINHTNGRVLRFAISRAFGDVRCKWREEDTNLAREKYGGLRPIQPPGIVKTPPYFTAEPEVTETVIESGPAHPDFLIMASDGFWDYVSSEDAVYCVAEWLRRAGKQNQREEWSREEATDPKFPFTDEKDYLSWRVSKEDFVYESTSNAALHLAQNAFGGRRRDLFIGVMSTTGPISRNVRDDISIQVIFFKTRDEMK
jgi:pyruvate dehydrogenase phosphatase